MVRSMQHSRMKGRIYNLYCKACSQRATANDSRITFVHRTTVARLLEQSHTSFNAGDPPWFLKWCWDLGFWGDVVMVLTLKWGLMLACLLTKAWGKVRMMLVIPVEPPSYVTPTPCPRDCHLHKKTNPLCLHLSSKFLVLFSPQLRVNML